MKLCTTKFKDMYGDVFYLVTLMTLKSPFDGQIYSYDLITFFVYGFLLVIRSEILIKEISIMIPIEIYVMRSDVAR